MKIHNSLFFFNKVQVKVGNCKKFEWDLKRNKKLLFWFAKEMGRGEKEERAKKI